MYREPDPPVGGCPTCRRQLERVKTLIGHQLKRCPECGGIWLTLLTFESMWREMDASAAAPVLSPRRTDVAGRHCPICRTPMAPIQLLTIPLDQCGIHGIWFDVPELTVALAGASLSPHKWRELFDDLLRKMT